MSVNSTETPFNLTSYKIGEDINSISVPIYTTFGILGNILSFTVIVSSNLIQSTTCMYMIVIAVLDTVILIPRTGVLMEIYNRDLIICNLASFLFYFPIHCVALLIVAMTFERYIVVKYPLKAAGWVTKTRTKRIILAVVVFSSLINIPQITMKRIAFDAENFKTRCFYEGESNVFFFAKIYPWIDAIVYCYFPVSSLMILNILIIKNLKTSKQNLNECTNRRSVINKQQTQITIMLILVSCAFLILTGPVGAMLVIEKYLWIPKSLEDLGRFHLIHAVTDNMMFINHALNFILYVVSGKKFRKELKIIFLNKMLCKYCFRKKCAQREEQICVHKFDEVSPKEVSLDYSVDLG
ncbi:hypothetical protein SNE40_012340 [Patella caerulea]|uniref:G-protein coupled receptors family 1 profile domain-containing protein n=1 Tax=Patella caerulea TaxID=87958 RepID=A0AAN8Q0Q8_PATCE